MLLSDNAGDGGAPCPSVSNVYLFWPRRQLSRYFSLLAVYRRCARGRSEFAVHFFQRIPSSDFVNLALSPCASYCYSVLSPSVVMVSFNLAIHLFRVIAVLYIFLLTFFSSLAMCYVACRYIRSFHLLVTPVLALLAGVLYPHLTHPCALSLSFYIFTFDHHIYSHCDQVIRFVSLTCAFMFACFHSLIADAFCLSSTVHSWLYRPISPILLHVVTLYCFSNAYLQVQHTVMIPSSMSVTITSQVCLYVCTNRNGSSLLSPAVILYISSAESNAGEEGQSKWFTSKVPTQFSSRLS